MKRITFILIVLMFGNSVFAFEATHNEKSKKTVKVEIDEDGFKPAKIKVHKGEELVLLVTRKTDKTCMKELKNADGTNQVKLPLNKEVMFKVGSLNESGEVKLLCGMDMTAGIISVL